MQKTMIVLATKNAGKLKEIQALLQDHAVDLKSLADFGPLPEAVEDGATFDDNAYKKALHYAKVLGVPCLADDSGLSVEALDGQPGVHSARYAGEHGNDAANCAKLLTEMADKSDRRAHFSCVLSLAVPSGPALTWEGRCDGEILTEARGENGFGYDPVFFYPPFGKSFAEVSMTEKSAVSHRGKALAEFAAEFPKVLKWLDQRMNEVKPPKPDHRQFLHNDWSRDRMV